MKPRPRDNIAAVQELKLSADELVSALLRLSETEPVCLLDSCGVGHLGSHLTVAGLAPLSAAEIANDDPEDTLQILESALLGEAAAFFTISYGFGEKLVGITGGTQRANELAEPDVYLALFDTVVIHDHQTGETRVEGDAEHAGVIAEKINAAAVQTNGAALDGSSTVTSDFKRAEYLDVIEQIKESIRDGDTYQTNLTQQLRVHLAGGVAPQDIYRRMRDDHPAPFAAFITRPSSTVVSASPERFFSVDLDSRIITTSPIKGTRPRGAGPAEDDALRDELRHSEKDRAENTMIVDLLRNDIGRVCEFGSVTVEKLCDLEEHPTLFHLVSTISGRLRSDVGPADIFRAVFPCGSITGAPKISTMRIIADIEHSHRGLSMGAIGYYLPGGRFGLPGRIDLSVAIRTMTIAGRTAVMNVGGGIVIDSDPASEYDESLTKALALLNATGGSFKCDGH